jgi:hypothetical protein
VYPVDGWTVPLAETVAVPAVIPPIGQLVGAADWGPKTLKVIVPVGSEPEAMVEPIEPAGIAVPATPVEGPVTVMVGVALEIDSF